MCVHLSRDQTGYGKEAQKTAMLMVDKKGQGEWLHIMLQVRICVSMERWCGVLHCNPLDKTVALSAVPHHCVLSDVQNDGLWKCPTITAAYTLVMSEGCG
jgi:hypothetical protein